MFFFFLIPSNSKMRSPTISKEVKSWASAGERGIYDYKNTFFLITFGLEDDFLSEDMIWPDIYSGFEFKM